MNLNIEKEIDENCRTFYLNVEEKLNPDTIKESEEFKSIMMQSDKFIKLLYM